MPEDPTKGLKYLYLTDADHATLSQAAGGPSYRAEPLTGPDGQLQFLRTSPGGIQECASEHVGLCVTSGSAAVQALQAASP